MLLFSVRESNKCILASCMPPVDDVADFLLAAGIDPGNAQVVRVHIKLRKTWIV